MPSPVTNGKMEKRGVKLYIARGEVKEQGLVDLDNSY